MRINAHELALLFHIGDYIVDRHFRRRSRRRRHRKNRQAGLGGRAEPFERTHIRELRIGNDYAYRLRSVHGRAAANRDDGICLRLFRRLHTVLYVLNRRIWLDVAVDGVGDFRRVEDVGDLFRDTELDEVGI